MAGHPAAAAYSGMAGGLTVFDIRLGLTVLDALDALESADQPRASHLVDSLIRRTTQARSGYEAREVLTHPLFLVLATDSQVQDCKDLVRACALDAGTLSDALNRDLCIALDRSEAMLHSSVTSGTACGSSVP